MQIDRLTTETRNERTTELDAMPTAEMLQVMNEEDAMVARAVGRAIPDIARAVELISTALRGGGRLVYLGAGTSGRLGVLDAVECPPTFGTDPATVVGLIAGGKKAFTDAVEGAEDDAALAVEDLEAVGLCGKDVLVGLTASGRTPYVIGGLDYARRMGAGTVSVACNTDAQCSQHAEVGIEVDAGPEVLTGSTRLKAGTAQKMVCNMLSTASMVSIGKVYGNLMVDVQPTNEKLVDRARRIVMAATDASAEEATSALKQTNGHAKPAIVMILAQCSLHEAEELLDRGQGSVRNAVASRTL